MENDLLELFREMTGLPAETVAALDDIYTRVERATAGASPSIRERIWDEVFEGDDCLYSMQEPL